MADRAYDYMDWAAIEGVVYSEENHPKEVMGPRAVKEGTLYQCFWPGAETVWFKNLKTGRRHKMTMEDEAGYFACVISGKKTVPHVFMSDGETRGDPYSFENQLTKEEEARFTSGISNRIYRKLGAHKMTLDGQDGLFFAVWAPNAMRVSVVGEFNSWDGRVCPMQFHDESGVFELFIPNLGNDTTYRYELKLKNGDVYTRIDPYANAFDQKDDSPVSVAVDLSYRWHDRAYLEKRAEKKKDDGAPLSIFECSLSEWAQQHGKKDYRSLADDISSYVRKMGYTHIELKPVMEYPDDQSEGYQTTGYFAPTSRFGKAVDFKYFVDQLHQNGIGVICDWTPAQFSADERWLAEYDGTCLYEHLDPRQGIHPLWHSKLYNYGRPQVRSFLLSSADFWMREYHVDGLRLDGCSTMLRVDYCRGDNWVPNMYGSNENLDGIEFLKQLSSSFHNAFPDGLLIIEEDVDWPDLTQSTDSDGFGFDYKWNLHFTNDMLTYLRSIPDGAAQNHELLLNGMIHNYLDRFIISFSRGVGRFDAKAFLDALQGTDEEKMARLRTAYAYLFTHPGRKLLTAGEDFQPEYMKRLLTVYRNEPALWAHDFEEEGFEWINTMGEGHSILSYLRKADKEEDTLLVVCNFSDEDFAQYQVGVPYAGNYREILNSDDLLYGGSGELNPRARVSRKEEFDERENSLRIRLAPRSAAIFKYEGPSK